MKNNWSELMITGRSHSLSKAHAASAPARCVRIVRRKPISRNGFTLDTCHEFPIEGIARSHARLRLEGERLEIREVQSPFLRRLTKLAQRFAVLGDEKGFSRFHRGMEFRELVKELPRTNL